jgi:hypothetical protein
MENTNFIEDERPAQKRALVTSTAEQEPRNSRNAKEKRFSVKVTLKNKSDLKKFEKFLKKARELGIDPSDGRFFANGKEVSRRKVIELLPEPHT